MPIPRSVSGALAAALLTLCLGGAAEAGVIWCVKDPIFVIDGRVVQVQDLVPVENADAPIHFVLMVAERSKVTWYVPEGETLLGSVTIVTDDRVKRDMARLWVRGEGAPFPMKVNVSGSGLRTPSFEVQGTSDGITLVIPLVKLSSNGSEDPS